MGSLLSTAEMRKYLLVRGHLVLLALLSVSGEDAPCGAGQQCVGFSNCPSFVRETTKLNSLTWGSVQWRRLLGKLRSLVCSSQQQKVCCELEDPDSPSYLPSLESQECGLDGASTAFVLGGEDTSIGEFPFLGRLGRKEGGNIEWRCGGSIINKWFLLSAAHCGPNVDYVRLGEWNVTESDTERIDCETVRGVETCSAPHQDIAVAEVRIHPDYLQFPSGLAENDIMLVKLSRPAVYNDFVHPVCLPSPDLAQYGELGAPVFGNNRPTVVGWGRTSNRRGSSADIQQKLVMSVRNNEYCIANYRNRFGVDLSDEISPSLHLCAGGELGEDSCNGDSGGPLMARRDELSPWQQVGVVSGGTKICGIGAPAIFTRVTQYSQWIRDNLN